MRIPSPWFGPILFSRRITIRRKLALSLDAGLSDRFRHRWLLWVRCRGRCCPSRRAEIAKNTLMAAVTRRTD
jgi:hypothetical protein